MTKEIAPYIPVDNYLASLMLAALTSSNHLDNIFPTTTIQAKALARAAYFGKLLPEDQFQISHNRQNGHLTSTCSLSFSSTVPKNQVIGGLEGAVIQHEGRFFKVVSAIVEITPDHQTLSITSSLY